MNTTDKPSIEALIAEIIYRLGHVLYEIYKDKEFSQYRTGEIFKEYLDKEDVLYAELADELFEAYKKSDDNWSESERNKIDFDSIITKAMKELSRKENFPDETINKYLLVIDKKGGEEALKVMLGEAERMRKPVEGEYFDKEKIKNRGSLSPSLSIYGRNPYYKFFSEMRLPGLIEKRTAFVSVAESIWPYLAIKENELKHNVEYNIEYDDEYDGNKEIRRFVVGFFKDPKEGERYFVDQLSKEREDAKKKGYMDQPSHAVLLKVGPLTLMEERKRHILLRLGQTGREGFLYHKVYEGMLRTVIEEGVNRDDVKDKLKNSEIEAMYKGTLDKDASILLNEDKIKPWARCGMGVWVITNDNKIALSKRAGGEILREVPDTISYSASGSYTLPRDNWRQSPAATMLQEMQEELGVNTSGVTNEALKIEAKDLVLFDIGIDAERHYVQFSYFIKVDADMETLTKLRSSAVDVVEFTMIFIDFSKESIRELMNRSRMEPGAAYSLQKLFLNKEYFEL